MSDRIQVTSKQKDTFDIIRSAVNKAVDLIAPTFGPSSNKVIISKVTHGFVLDDGVQIIRDLELEDPNENAALKVFREVAIKTNDRVGDGTTGALIMLRAIIEEVAKLSHFDGRKIEKELKTAFEECKSQLLKQANQIATKDELLKVARISFDNEKVAKLIADAWFALGKDGVLTTDRSGTMETFTQIENGIKMNTGYISPYMITDAKKMEGIVEKPYILFTDFRLTEVNDVLKIMEKMFAKQLTNLVIIADNVEQNALATIIVNKMQGKFDVIAVNAPMDDKGGNKAMILEDMALMTGGKMFSEKKGDKLDTVEISDLGRAERFIARRNESVIVGPKAKKTEIQKIIKDLEIAIAGENRAGEKEQLKQRVARFNNKIGVIRAGAATEGEVNTLRYKIDDSINATRAAFRGGVVCGGGIALSNIKTSSELLNMALQVPFRQLKMNVGIDNHKPLGKDEAINVVTGEIGNWQKVGVMDPVDVLIAQIESAISIASLLLTASGMIVERPKYIKQEEE